MKGIFEDNTDAKRAYREMHILRHLRHPSIVSLLNVIIPSKSDSGLHGVRNTAIISTAVIQLSVCLAGRRQEWQVLSAGPLFGVRVRRYRPKQSLSILQLPSEDTVLLYIIICMLDH